MIESNRDLAFSFQILIVSDKVLEEVMVNVGMVEVLEVGPVLDAADGLRGPLSEPRPREVHDTLFL